MNCLFYFILKYNFTWLVEISFILLTELYMEMGHEEAHEAQKGLPNGDLLRSTVCIGEMSQQLAYYLKSNMIKKK